MNRNSNISERIDDLIVKLLDRQITSKEEEELHAWVSKAEENRRYFVEMQYFWNAVTVRDKATFNSEAAFKRFKARVAIHNHVVDRKLHFRLFPALRYAAIIILAFALGGLSYYFVNNRIIQNDTKQYSIYVPYGAKTRVELPDKSVVWLNAGSSLHYKQNFGQKNRDVSLVGEGYFEITHDSSMPFTVNTNQASVRDLGTKFDVKAYPEDKNLVVTLLSGSIRLKTNYKPNKPLILKPDQSAIIDKEQHDLVVKQVDASKVVAWTKGKIIFDEVLFGNIVRQLEREYNVTIKVKDPQLNNLRFFGEFRSTQSIEEIFNIMTANNEFHYTMNNNVITVYR